MSASSIDERIIHIIKEKLGITESDFIPEANLKEDLGADDFDIVEITMELQREFELSIPYEDSSNFQTVGDMIAYLKRQLLG